MVIEMITADVTNKDDWIVGCTATSHMTWSSDLFDTLEEISKQVEKRGQYHYRHITIKDGPERSLASLG